MHFRIRGELLDEGFLPLMCDEDVISFLEYVPRFKEVEVYFETGISLVERHMMERMTSKGKGTLIQEIMDDDVNDVVRKEFDGDSGNSGKLPLLIFHQTTQVGKDGTIVANDFCIFDLENEFPPPWFTEIMLADKTKRPSDKFKFRKLLEEIDHVGWMVSILNKEMDEILFYGQSEVNFEHGIDGLNFEQEIDELLFYETNEVDFEQGMDGLNFEQEMDGMMVLALMERKALDKLNTVIEAQDVSDLIAIYDEPIDDEGDVVPVEVMLEDQDGDVILTKAYNVMVAQEMLEDQTRAIKRKRLMVDKEDEDDT
ncbi:hypothetical protein Tco_0348831 [Tanacetum coccineum]